jgi:hypothetical protein
MARHSRRLDQAIRDGNTGPFYVDVKGDPATFTMLASESLRAGNNFRGVTRSAMPSADDPADRGPRDEEDGPR